MSIKEIAHQFGVCPDCLIAVYKKKAILSITEADVKQIPKAENAVSYPDHNSWLYYCDTHYQQFIKEDLDEITQKCKDAGI
jgi:hypothetical protein